MLEKGRANVFGNNHPPGTAKRWMRCVLSVDNIAYGIRCANAPHQSRHCRDSFSPEGGSLTVNVYLRKNENM